MNLFNKFPTLRHFKSHTFSDWRTELFTGLTVAILLIPQSMAYARLAGVPEIYGLYSCLVPLLVYALLGTSRHLSVGPVAISSLLLLAGLSQVAVPFTQEYVGLVIFSGLLIGILQFLMGFFRLGFLVNFVSAPVISGFTSAAGIIITISQLKDLLGIDIPRSSHLHEILGYAFSHISDWNSITLLIGIGALIIILVAKKIDRRIPCALLVVILGTLLVYYFNLDKKGVAILGAVPQGLPSLLVPDLDFSRLKELLPTVLTVTFIGVVECIGIAKTIEAKDGTYRIRPNQELGAIGLSKIAGSFFQSIPSSGSFSRSAINYDQGAKSGWASVFTAIFVALALLFFMPFLYHLPTAVLAAIIISAVVGLVEVNTAVHLWKNHRNDFYMMLATFIITLTMGMDLGVLAGVLLSVVVVLVQTSQPHYAVLGNLAHSKTYKNIKRYPHAEQYEDIIILRFDEQLYFANAAYFQDLVQKEIRARKKGQVQLFILDASRINRIDSTGTQALEKVYSYLKSNHIKCYLASLVGPVRDKILKDGFLQEIGPQCIFLSVAQAVDYHLKEKQGLEAIWNPDAVQINHRDKKT